MKSKPHEPPQKVQILTSPPNPAPFTPTPPQPSRRRILLRIAHKALAAIKSLVQPTMHGPSTLYTTLSPHSR